MVKARLQCLDGTERLVQCVRHGDLLVHRVIKDSRPTFWTNGCEWAVSHAHTGLLMLGVDQEADARRIVEFLWSRQCLAFGKEQKDEVTKKLSGWVVPWVRECRRQKGWVEPGLFLKREED